MSATTSLALTRVPGLVDLAKEIDENRVTPGVLGFLVFAAMGLAVWMLLKSMNRHMGKIDFDDRPPRGPERS